jgi:hypothetical protein
MLTFVKKSSILLFGSALVFGSVFGNLTAAHAQWIGASQEVVSPNGFDPGRIIEDKVFSDTKTFGSAAGVQQFLTSKGSVLANTDPNFLIQLKEPSDVNVKQGVNDPEPNLGRLRTAAELIYDAATSQGMNPQVLLVALQKEQGLITNTPTNMQRVLDVALGFGCPDSGGCDGVYVGFYSQLFGNFDSEGNRYLGAAGSLMRSFNTPGGRGPLVDAQGQVFGTPKVRTAHVGDTIVIDNTQGPPNNAAPTQVVTIANNATAALYRYTPHVYNGNYNFWKYFSQWFRYANGTLIRVSGDNNLYIINNGAKSVVPNFVAIARGLNLAATITVSPTELDSYPVGPLYAPADNTVIKISTDPTNKLYAFLNGTKYPVSSFVLQQRGISDASAIVITQIEADMFNTGTLLVPKDGTLIKGDVNPATYVIKDAKRMLLTPFTFKQYGYLTKNVVTLPQSEVDAYTMGSILLPKDGTLVRYNGELTVYYMKDKILHPVMLNVFKLHKFSFTNVAVVAKGDLEGTTIGTFMFPPDGTYFRVNPLGIYYYYSNGSKHHISPFVFKQRGVAKVSIDIGTGEAHDMPDGLALPPIDGTLVKSDVNPTIYAIEKGQKVALDPTTWAVKYKKKAPTVLSQEEVDSYPAQGQNAQ